MKKSKLLILQVSEPPGEITRFVQQIVDYAPPSVEHTYFRWHRALFSSYDVIHFHWPEHLVRSRMWPIQWVKQVLFVLLMLRLKYSRVRIVRTLHNVRPHNPGSLAEGKLLSILDRLTHFFVVLNPYTPVPAGKPSALIPHGHYLESFRGAQSQDGVPGRLLFIGSIRSNKGLLKLMKAFVGLEDSRISLRIAGNPSDIELSQRVQDAVRQDSRISCDLRLLTDEEMVAEVLTAELVVLPYDDMHNSGILFVILSCGRPVLVPESEVASQMADEIGTEWILTYSGELRHDTLANALLKVRQSNLYPVRSGPNLVGRDWRRIADDYSRVYGELVSGTLQREGNGR